MDAGSRAPAEFRGYTDLDHLAIVPDDAPGDIETPASSFRLRPEAGANAETFTMWMTELDTTGFTLKTISYAVAQECVRLEEWTQ